MSIVIHELSLVVLSQFYDDWNAGSVEPFGHFNIICIL